MKFHRTNRYAGISVVIVATFVATSAMAKQPVTLDSAVFVERQQAGNVRRLEPAQRLIRGDRVITIVTWQKLAHTAHGDGSFIVTNPLPQAIAYQTSAREDEEVSIDGGRSWGKLATLRVGSRLATPEDVTHVRWRVPAARAAKGHGQITYSGIVR